MKVKFFLKADEGRDGVKRVREWVEQENGFVGLAGDMHKKAAPVAYAHFLGWLKKEGEDKLQEVCREQGEVHMPEDPRRSSLVKKDLEKAKDAVAALEEELKASLAGEKEAAPKEKKKEAKND